MEHAGPAHSDTTRLGSFEILRKLARGGMAEIFLARTSGPSGFEKLVVLKKILAKYADKPRYVQLFLDEAKLAASLDHPNIAQTYDIGMSDGSYFFTMEYLHGQDVRSILHRSWRIGERFPIEHAVQIARHVASALHFAHEKRGGDGGLLGLVHRDVSPSNVIVTYDGATKLLDFGVAKSALSTVKTRTGALKGKISYMSPEQARGAMVDRRSDIFSLGIVLWEMVATQRLYRAENDLATLQMIITQPPRPPSQVRPDCPRELERIVLRALAQNPDARYPTAAHLAADLDELAREHRLKQTSNALAATLSQLFATELRAWQKAQALGVPLADHLHEQSALTAAVRESDLIEIDSGTDAGFSGGDADDAADDDDDDVEELDLEGGEAGRGELETARARPLGAGIGLGIGPGVDFGLGAGRDPGVDRGLDRGLGIDRGVDLSLRLGVGPGFGPSAGRGLGAAPGAGRGLGVADGDGDDDLTEHAAPIVDPMSVLALAQATEVQLPEPTPVMRSLAIEPLRPDPTPVTRLVVAPIAPAPLPVTRAMRAEPSRPGLRSDPTPLGTTRAEPVRPELRADRRSDPAPRRAVLAEAVRPEGRSDPTPLRSARAQIREVRIDRLPVLPSLTPEALQPEPTLLGHGAPSGSVTVPTMPRATPSSPFPPPAMPAAPHEATIFSELAEPVARSPFAAAPWRSGQPSPQPPEPMPRPWSIIDLPAFDPDMFARQRRLVLRIAAAVVGAVILLALLAGHC